MRKFVSCNPFNNQTIKEFPFFSNQQLNLILDNCQIAIKAQKKVSLSEKTQRLLKLAQLIDSNAIKYAELITTEMGKPITQAIGEVKKSAGHCRFYAENLDKFIKQKRVKTEAKNSYVIHQPIGTILQIVPFNFPFWLAFKSAIPNLALGNSVLLRNSDNTPLVGLAIEELMKEAGFDQFEYQNLLTSYEQTETLLKSNIVQGVSFTGSTKAGRQIASLAGQNLKKSVMELGGNDPFIVLNDADIELATELAIKARLKNSGQICNSSKRFIIQKSVHSEFVSLLQEKISKIKIGNPLLKETDMGPLARRDILHQVHTQVVDSQLQGGIIIQGGSQIQSEICNQGNFYHPTLIEVNSDNLLFKEEVFGPVISITQFETEDQALNIANNSNYGLGSVIVSRDYEKAEILSKQIEAGSVFINEVTVSDSRLPSGGIKNSGYGRECGQYGFDEFSNIKTVWIN